MRLLIVDTLSRCVPVIVSLLSNWNRSNTTHSTVISFSLHERIIRVNEAQPRGQPRRDDYYDQDGGDGDYNDSGEY